MRRTIFVAVLVTSTAGLSALSSPALAQATAALAPPIATDCPGNGDAPTTVPPLCLQIEGSANYALDLAPSGNTSTFSFPTFLRFGLVRGLELRVGSGLVGLDASGGDASVVGATDTSVGAKVQLLHDEGWTPDLGLVTDVYLPSGQGPFTDGAVVPDSRVAASWGLPDGFGILLNAGVDVPVDARGRFARFVYVANVSWSPPVLEGRLSFFVESFGRIALASGHESVEQIDLGGAFRLGDNWQVDAYTQQALTAASPDFQVAIGLSGRTNP